MADLVAERFGHLRGRALFDVAAGAGKLGRQLEARGFGPVHLAESRRGSPLDWRFARRDLELVVAMHPDEATDHAVLLAGACGAALAVCPCCVKPDAVPFRHDGNGLREKSRWRRHLEGLARASGLRTEWAALDMSGDALVLLGSPSAASELPQMVR